jgi:hypothetical protein
MREAYLREQYEFRDVPKKVKLDYGLYRQGGGGLFTPPEIWVQVQDIGNGSGSGHG